jgi:hypothetical protein
MYRARVFFHRSIHDQFGKEPFKTLLHGKRLAKPEEVERRKELRDKLNLHPQ